jgi:hypothetical protein
MTTLTVTSRTQRIVVDPASHAVAVINLGPQGPVGNPTYYIKADGSVPMTGDLVLAGDPNANLEAATKQYVDKVYRFRGSRASTSYATGDTTLTSITTVENLNNPVSVASGVVTFLVAGTYSISAAIGGASQAAASALKATVTGRGSIAAPTVPATTWKSPLTFTAHCAVNDTLSFDYRNGGASVSLAFDVEIVKIA